MNMITLSKNKYVQILNTQEKLRGDLNRLQKIVSHIAQDEITSAYATKLSKVEKGLSAGKGVNFKNKDEVRKFFRSI